MRAYPTLVFVSLDELCESDCIDHRVRSPNGRRRRRRIGTTSYDHIQYDDEEMRRIGILQSPSLNGLLVVNK